MVTGTGQIFMIAVSELFYGFYNLQNVLPLYEKKGYRVKTYQFQSFRHCRHKAARR